MMNERWVVPRVDLTPDPRSRFYDPYDPDSPPLPPDDPAANQYMHWVDGMLGYQSWHKFGQTLTVENPQWLENFGIPMETAYCGPEADYSYEGGYSRPVPVIEELTMGDAIELTYINSREFQFELEDLFLTALQLTFQRFRYDVQFLGIGGNKPSSDLVFDTVPGGENSLLWDNRVGISKLLPSGGQWAVEFINNTLWLFSGDNKTNTASTLSFSLVQPLLLGGGRKVALESLTQSERDALYQMRDFARFRKTFFVDIVDGTRGFLGLLGLRQAIINQESNIRQIEIQIRRLRALSEERPNQLSEELRELPADIVFPDSVADRISYDDLTNYLFWEGEMNEEERDVLLALSDDPAYRLAIRELFQRTTSEVTSLEIAQLETDLAGGKSQLLRNQVAFQDALDRYKIQTGLPTDSEITIDESLLVQFQLIDPRFRALESQVERFLESWAVVDDDDPQQALLLTEARRLLELQTTVRNEGLENVVADFDKLRDIWDRRLNDLPSEEDRDRFSRDTKRDKRLFESLVAELNNATQNLQTIIKELSGEELPLEQRRQRYVDIDELQEILVSIVQGMEVVQINTRVELIELQPFDLSIQDAVRLGMQNRLDLMNQRAFVMDVRRQLEVAANQLEAVLDVVLEGDVRTRPLLSGNNKPLDFRGMESNYRAGLAFTAPVVQIQERNEYRAALIAYQRARRAFMQAEDTIKQEIRDDWRSLQANRASFEITRQAVRAAAIQFDQSVDATIAPLQPGQNRSLSLGLNLLTALESILRTQNSLISGWVQYETSRLQVNRDMGTMVIDDTGVWVDKFYQERKGVRASFANPNVQPPEHFVPPPPAPAGEFPADAVQLDGPMLGLPDDTELNRRLERIAEREAELQKLFNLSLPEDDDNPQAAPAQLEPAGTTRITDDPVLK